MGCKPAKRTPLKSRVKLESLITGARQPFLSWSMNAMDTGHRICCRSCMYDHSREHFLLSYFIHKRSTTKTSSVSWIATNAPARSTPSLIRSCKRALNSLSIEPTLADHSTKSRCIFSEVIGAADISCCCSLSAGMALALRRNLKEETHAGRDCWLVSKGGALRGR
jgi:hypothetical protein